MAGGSVAPFARGSSIALPRFTAKPWETALILCGLMGVTVGAFHWSASPALIRAKQAIAGWLVRRDILWPLEPSAPWWLLTNHPARNDVLNLLDDALLLGYILAVAVLMGMAQSALIALAPRCVGPWSWLRFHHLAQARVLLAGCGAFLGLSVLTVSTLRAEGMTLGGRRRRVPGFCRGLGSGRYGWRAASCAARAQHGPASCLRSLA